MKLLMQLLDQYPCANAGLPSFRLASRILANLSSLPVEVTLLVLHTPQLFNSAHFLFSPPLWQQQVINFQTHQ